MKSPVRLHAPATAPAALLTRILDQPGLVAAVRQLPGAVLGRLIERVGLEDAGELVALASTAQLERVFDDDLWRAERAGGDETFRPERFALWLRVMQEAGDEALVRRLCELPEELVALGVHRLVLVMDLDVIEEQLSPGDEEARELERALENACSEEWEEFRLIAREPDAWDDVWGALLALDRDHHERLRAILERCRDMTSEFISGQGGLFQVLSAEEMLDSDVAAARDDRRSAEGFVSPADARAFLTLARRGAAPGAERDPISLAYFRGLAPPTAESARADKVERAAATVDVRTLTSLLQEAEVIAPPAAQRLLSGVTAAEEAPSHLAAPLLERAMAELREKDPMLFATRVRELGYLANVWMAGGTEQGRRPRPAEALERVLETCEAGMRAPNGGAAPTPEDAVAILARVPADILFRRGFGAAR